MVPGVQCQPGGAVQVQHRGPAGVVPLDQQPGAASGLLPDAVVAQAHVALAHQPAPVGGLSVVVDPVELERAPPLGTGDPGRAVVQREGMAQPRTVGRRGPGAQVGVGAADQVPIVARQPVVMKGVVGEVPRRAVGEAGVPEVGSAPELVVVGAQHIKAESERATRLKQPRPHNALPLAPGWPPCKGKIGGEPKISGAAMVKVEESSTWVGSRLMVRAARSPEARGRDITFVAGRAAPSVENQRFRRPFPVGGLLAKCRRPKLGR